MNNIFNIDTTTGIEEKIAVEKILVIEQDYGAARLAEFTLDIAGY